MKLIVKHEIRGRIRIHICGGAMTIRQADLFAAYLGSLSMVSDARVYERTGDASIIYTGEKKELIQQILKFDPEDPELNRLVPENSGRELNQKYQTKLVGRTALRITAKFFFPAPVRAAFVLIRSAGFLAKGIRCLMKRKLGAEVLDAAAVIVSLARRDFDTAGSIMFLLGMGELLEEWTHKKSVGDLARSLSLNIEKVWLKTENSQILVPITEVKEGDEIVVCTGNVIPLDGEVSSGEAMVHQASMTGESIAVRKAAGSYVYAGTVTEEGNLTVVVKKTSGSTRFERITAMIEESEKLKSVLEGKAASLADTLVPWSFGGTLLTWLLTRSPSRAISVLMVDFSCALKLSMPLAVLSAMREASSYGITVKGGVYLEAMAEADTIVFDKTGTLTKAEPVVAGIVPFEGRREEDVLRLAACLEEHFPHSIANAVVAESRRRRLIHEEMHSQVDYIVAHGIATYVGNERAVIGSRHFVFEDEKCVVPEGEEDLFQSLPEEFSHLYLALGGRLAAVILIEDPLREEAPAVVAELRKLGIRKVVMMTGDSERTARAIAARTGMDDYRSEVLPEDKAAFVEQEKAEGHRVIMVGDGINDSPALSAADVGIAVSEGAQIAREIADITVSGDVLEQLVILRTLSTRLMQRVRKNYRFVIGFNLALMGLGVSGIMPPALSALCHNSSTLLVSLESMTNLLRDY